MADRHAEFGGHHPDGDPEAVAAIKEISDDDLADRLREIAEDTDSWRIDRTTREAAWRLETIAAMPLLAKIVTTADVAVRLYGPRHERAGQPYLAVDYSTVDLEPAEAMLIEKMLGDR